MITTKLKIIKRMFLVVIIIFFWSFSNVFALEIDNLGDEYKNNINLYQYNALENKIFFSDLINKENEENIQIEELIATDNLEKNTSEKLQEIIKKQNFSIKQVKNATNIIENKNKVSFFLVGNSLGTLRFQLVQIKDLISSLNILFIDSEDNFIKNQINDQINLLKEEKIKVENFLLRQEKRFSLFGWFVAML